MTTYSSPKNDLAARLQIVIHQKNATIAGLEAELKRYRDALAGFDPEAVPELVEAVREFMDPSDCDGCDADCDKCSIGPMKAALAKVKKVTP